MHGYNQCQSSINHNPVACLICITPIHIHVAGTQYTHLLFPATFILFCYSDDALTLQRHYSQAFYTLSIQFQPQHHLQHDLTLRIYRFKHCYSIRRVHFGNKYFLRAFWGSADRQYAFVQMMLA